MRLLEIKADRGKLTTLTEFVGDNKILYVFLILSHMAKSLEATFERPY
jgi:hypothetical protein